MIETNGHSENNDMNTSFRIAVASAAAMSAGLGIGRFAYTPILPEMMQGLGLSASAAGALASANLIGYLAGAIAATSKFVSGSRKFWLILALFINAFALIAMGLTDGFNLQLATRFINGVASAFVFVFSLALLLEASPPAQHPTLSAIHFSGVGAGVILSAALVGVLTTFQFTWPVLWFGCGLCCLAIAAVVGWIVEDKKQSTTPAKPVHSQTSARARKSIIIAYGLFGFGYIITATFLIALVRNSKELAEIEPWIWAIFGLSVMPSVFFWNRIAKYKGVYFAFALACIAEAFGVLLSIAWPTALGLVITAVLLGGTFAGVTALGMTAIRMLQTADARRDIALMTVSFGIGQAIGPILAGYTADLTGHFALATACAAVALLGSALIVASLTAAHRKSA